MDGVREYYGEMDYGLAKTAGKLENKPEKDWEGKGRIVVKAHSKSAHSILEIDLDDLMDWIGNNKSKIEELKKEEF